MEIKSLKISFSEEDRAWITDRIDECLATGQLSQGKFVMEFEEELKKYLNVKQAIAVNSGTGAIDLVMKILDVNNKDVLVPTNTFLATAVGVKFSGGNVKLVDIDPKTLSVSLKSLKERVTKNTAGVIIVHIGGIVTPEIEDIREWCDRNGLWLFEDAAHAIGSSFHGKFAGTFGIAGSFSLFATKVITSAEGGAIVTNDDELAEKIKLFRNHGKPKPWDTYHTSLGSNYRMHEITAIIALSQLRKLDKIIQERDRIANMYTEKIKQHLPELELILPEDRSNWYKYTAMLPNEIDREVVKSRLKEKNINLQGEVYGIPLHKQPIADMLDSYKNFEVADNVCSRHICLPIYQGLTDSEINYVVEELAKVIAELKK
ncbi:MAG TPA: DegT/DnrJ/EryC1/StrS family aminotransferase [Clostridium sp.]|nr:hypothetical protein A7W90_08445 [Clostridium sp. Bc-iso-3]HHV28108.1 DegT/DnrJ/EryC1/StrS family aminotransferase [Clostridium sp.]